MNEENRLPILGNLATISIVTIVITGLSASAAIAGVVYRDLFYPTPELAQTFLPNDFVILFIGLPILLGSMWVARSGRLMGLLFWPGALFFGLYNSIAYVYALPFSWGFLMHLALVVLGVYSLIALVAMIDGEKIKQALCGAVHEKIGGGVLTGFGILFLLRAMMVLGSALISSEVLAKTELALNLADIFIGPAFVAVGIGLLKQKRLGYVGGLGLLFQASMLFVGLIVFLILQPMLTDTPFAAIDVIVVSVMGLICFIPFILFMRGVQSKSSKRRISHAQRTSSARL